MPEQDHGAKSNLLFPNSIFNIHREHVPANWMEGFSKHFFDFTVTIDAESLTVQHMVGPSR